VEYQPRVVDADLDDLVASVPAVVVVGPKAVGKTESCRRLARTVVDLSDADERIVVSADRAAALAAAEPVLIDEWQHDPATWETMRRAVDLDPRPGRFLLTGSSNPREVRVHSGAGRVVRVRMRPLSLFERGVGTPTVSMADLWAGRATIGGTTDVTVADYAQEIVDSGLPGIRFGPQRSRARLLQGYLQSVLEHDVPELGLTPRRPQSLAQWLRAYAAASSTTTTYTNIAAAVPDGDRPTRATIDTYRDVLAQLWLLDQVPAFTLSRNRLAELGQMPKHQLADPALAAAALRVTPRTLLAGTADEQFRGLRDGPLLGTLFEALATLCVRVYATALDLDVSHIRTARGEHEVDLVVHSPDGRALGFEVKLAAAATSSHLTHLRWLADKMGDDLVDRVVLTTGTRAYRHPDGTAVVPLALLGP